MINIDMTTSLYDDLELPKTCTSEEIKQKYRILAQLHHPDKGGDEEKFKRIKLAYEVLSNPINREHYDATGDHYEDNNLQSEVMSRLSIMILFFIQNINPEIDDLILKIKIEIRSLQEQSTNAITECNNLITKLNLISKKIKLKKEGENFLKAVVDKKIVEIHTQLINHKKGLIIYAKMLEVLEDYHFSNTEWQLLLQNTDGPA